jgi:hypothetical protein
MDGEATLESCGTRAWLRRLLHTIAGQLVQPAVAGTTSRAEEFFGDNAELGL